MRVAFLGANEITVRTARALIERDHEVIIVERDRERIDELSEKLDCGLIHGDGSRPDVLKEVGPEQTDMLFCLSDEDQINIIASLVGRSLGFGRVVTSITDSSYEAICRELGLDDVIVPSRTIARYLADMARGLDVMELSSAIRHDARLFSFTAGKTDAGPIEKIELPDGARVICLYRESAFYLAEPDSTIHKGDDVVILTRSENLESLRERWEPKQVDSF